MTPSAATLQDTHGRRQLLATSTNAVPELTRKTLSGNHPLGLQAYRDLARLTHPDKVQGDGPEKEAAQKKFLDIAEAYEVCHCEHPPSVLGCAHAEGERGWLVF